MSLFYELIQVALGLRRALSRTPSELEWNDIFIYAQEQAVIGITLEALNMICEKGQKPPIGLLYEFIGQAEQLRLQNELLDKRCGEITRLFEVAGFKTCILKGQGNANLYPNPHSRTPGDIDIWIYGMIEGNKLPLNKLRKKITAFVKEYTPNVFEQSHHIDFPIFKDVIVEVHYVPNILSRPKYHRLFLDWCFKSIGEPENIYYLDSIESYVPSAQFNVIYQLVHMFSHFFTEGIGLRHFVDYYYVLKNVHANESILNTLHELGLIKFTRGVMWVEREYLGLEDDFLLLEPSRQIGALLLKEMEKGGNFGQYDNRYSIRKKGLWARGAADIVRLVTLTRMFPSECFWKVIEKIANQKWKLKLN